MSPAPSYTLGSYTLGSLPAGCRCSGMPPSC